MGVRIVRSIPRRSLQALLDAAALGVVLAVADAALHADAGYWLAHPLATLRAFWYVMPFYVLGVLVLSAVLRRRDRVVFVSATGFVFAQSALWVGRGGLAESGLFPKLIFVLVSIIVGGLAYRLLKKLPVASRASVILVSGAVLLAVIPTLWPASEVRPDVAWLDASSGGLKPDGPRPNLLLISLDTTRPDRLSAYGYETIETANLDSLASGGALFLRGVAPAPITPPSHASILTGMYPAKHGLREFLVENRLSPEYPLLTELLKEVGYSTAALIASNALNPVYGLARGFDVYRLVIEDNSLRFGAFRHAFVPSLLRRLGLVRDYGYRDASSQADDAIAWIRRNATQPFFLWVHFYDPHLPYNLHPQFGHPRYHQGANFLDRFKLSYRYDSEVLGVDHEIGRILRELRALRLLDETLVTVISDHGEGLGDHGYMVHGARLFQEQLRLVLLLHYPQAIPGGVKVETQVRSVDLMPTILQILGLEPPDGLDGRSLLELLAPGDSDTVAADRVAFAHSGEMLAVSDGQYKMIRSPAQEWLFDLLSDPGETHNLAGSLPEIEEALRSLLLSYEALSKSSGSQQLDEKLLEQLKALGYMN